MRNVEKHWIPKKRYKNKLTCKQHFFWSYNQITGIDFTKTSLTTYFIPMVRKILEIEKSDLLIKYTDKDISHHLTIQIYYPKKWACRKQK